MHPRWWSPDFWTINSIISLKTPVFFSVFFHWQRRRGSGVCQRLLANLWFTTTRAWSERLERWLVRWDQKIPGCEHGKMWNENIGIPPKPKHSMILAVVCDWGFQHTNLFHFLVEQCGSRWGHLPGTIHLFSNSLDMGANLRFGEFKFFSCYAIEKKIPFTW